MTRLMDTNLAHLAQLKAEGKLQELERECWRIYDIVANGICSILKKLSSLEGEKIKGESKRGEASLTTTFPLPLIKGKGDKGGWGY